MALAPAIAAPVQSPSSARLIASMVPTTNPTPGSSLLKILPPPAFSAALATSGATVLTPAFSKPAAIFGASAAVAGGTFVNPGFIV